MNLYKVVPYILPCVTKSFIVMAESKEEALAKTSQFRETEDTEAWEVSLVDDGIYREEEE